jgi:hypothetical protein
MPKAAKQRGKRVKMSKEVEVAAALDRFDRLYVENGSHTNWRHWPELVALLITFLAGAATIWTFGSHFEPAVSATWKVVLISAATLCVGFGAASLFYGRMLDKEARALQADFSNLRSHADALVEKFDEYERSKRAP